MTEANTEWFYIIGGERLGPVTFSDLKARYENGELTEKTLVWTKSYADDWKRIAEVPGMREASEPPLVPTGEIQNHWLYMLILVPLVMSFVEAILMRTGTDTFNTGGMPGLSFLLFFFANTICALFDQNAVERSGRKDAADGLLVWILLLVPAYIFLRSKRTGLGSGPLFAWIGMLVLGGFISVAWPGSGYTMSGLPKCDSRASMSMIEDLYPNIPINFANAEVVKITDIKEVKYSEALGQRECSATVQNTSGTATPIALTISETNNQFYFQVRFSNF
ncbi:DUF4339 domain-containing protein [Pseudophaeobacter sp. TrK17]|uniref:DUF4339 domain-containing protein n=1 Tax=Pseudophaeobacter sp. TrK17 TaxID=2815167 RepID=UPI0035D0C51D